MTTDGAGREPVNPVDVSYRMGFKHGQEAERERTRALEEALVWLWAHLPFWTYGGLRSHIEKLIPDANERYLASLAAVAAEDGGNGDAYKDPVAWRYRTAGTDEPWTLTDSVQVSDLAMAREDVECEPLSPLPGGTP